MLKSFKTDLSKGLTDAQVTKLRAEYGTNELDKEEGTPLWKLVLQQFDDLLAAAPTAEEKETLTNRFGLSIRGLKDKLHALEEQLH